MHIEEINKDRDKFLQNIQTSLEPELKKIGLVLINVNITDITDESGYIEAIGRKAASQAVQQAKVDVSQQEKMGQIGIAEAEREKAIQVANANKLREIGTREASREQAVRVALLEKEQKVGEQTAALERDAQIKEAQRQQAVRIAQLDKEQKVGEQNAALEREAQVKDAERKMRIAVADANAKAVAGENQAQAEIAAAQATLQVKQAEAYQVGETRKREAEAAVQEAQNRAMAKAISNIKFDKVIVWENGGNGNGTSNTAHFLQSLARTMPPMMQIMKDIGGVDLPEYIAKLTPESHVDRGTASQPAQEPNGQVPVPPKG